MIYYSSKEPLNFKTFKTVRSLGENIYSSKITMDEADEEQSDLIEYILNFNNKARPKNRHDKKKQNTHTHTHTKNVLNTAKNLYDEEN